MMAYVYLEDRAKADEAFKAWGASLEELFKSCSEALLGIMVRNPADIANMTIKKIEIWAVSLEFLLHDFLHEMLYIKEVEFLLLKVIEIKIDNVQGKWVLKAVLSGEPLMSYEKDLMVDVKAITFHDLYVRKREEDGWWEASVTVDI